MLKFQNPYYQAPTEKSLDDNVNKHAPAIDAWLKAQSGQKVVTLADIKAALPAVAADLDRVTVNVIMDRLGVPILNPDDPTP